MFQRSENVKFGGKFECGANAKFCDKFQRGENNCELSGNVQLCGNYKKLIGGNKLL
jgi:hypothetical protein